MRFIRRQSHKHGQAVIASLLTGIVLLLNALAASPALHEWFHHDAGEPEHQCAVTLFAHGQVDSASVDVPMVLPVASIETIAPAVISVFSSVIEQLPAGRAPPVLPAVS